MTLKELTIAEIRQLLAEKSERLAGLRAERKKLLGAIKEIDGRIARIAGVAKAPRKGRIAKPRRKSAKSARKSAKSTKRMRGDGPSLKALIVQALAKAGKPMTTVAVVDAVTRAGYSSASSNFRALVNVAMREMKQVRRVSRGKYALKK